MEKGKSGTSDGVRDTQATPAPEEVSVERVLEGASFPDEAMRLGEGAGQSPLILDARRLYSPISLTTGAATERRRPEGEQEEEEKREQGEPDLPEGGAALRHLRRSIPIRSDGGRLDGWYVVFAGSHRLKEAEEAILKLELVVEEQARQVRELSRALTLAEQRERQRIAVVLHDDLQQVLVGAKMIASTGPDSALSPERVEALQRALDEAVTLTRTLSHELCPSALKGEDLRDFLRWLTDQKRERHGMEVEVEVRGVIVVSDPTARVLLYQLLGELLFNVVKHAGTNRARVVAERTGEFVRVVVADEGTGFDVATLEGADGFGLPSVRERLELVGGRLGVESAPGRGTRVTVAIPEFQRAPA
jgi:signal transduction histidine kinase